jgi:hypothetical protein
MPDTGRTTPGVPAPATLGTNAKHVPAMLVAKANRTTKAKSFFIVDLRNVHIVKDPKSKRHLRIRRQYNTPPIKKSSNFY